MRSTFVLFQREAKRRTFIHELKQTILEDEMEGEGPSIIDQDTNYFYKEDGTLTE